MKGTTMRPRIGSLVLSAVLCLGFALLATCSGGSGSGGATAKTGSLAVNLQVENHQTAGLAQIDCAETGIDQVEAQVYDESNLLLASGGPWACDLHHGTITGVPAECNLKIVVFGRNVDGVITYLGEASGICVQADQTTNVDVTLLPFFPPFILSPTGEGAFFFVSSPTDQASVEFTWDSNQSRHILEIDNNPDFSSPEITVVVLGTSYTANFGVGTYYWRVRATDSTGNFETGWSPDIFTVEILG
jgi:hypothetical protein